jgi:FAD/FMN-containing dehydrogenase
VRRVFFTSFDRRTEAVVRIGDASDVACVVTLATQTGVELAIRSGGYPPATLKRLAQVKRRYDPDNLFHLNLSIAPDMKGA